VQPPGLSRGRAEHHGGTARPRTKEGRRAEAEARQRKSREIAPLRTRLKELEAEIAKIEARARDLTDQMANPDLYRDGDRAREVARERKALEEQAAALYGKWEELALRLENSATGDAK
jgi:ATP-binding cassette subfamily F protein 3